jgi:hypothetical protein
MPENDPVEDLKVIKRRVQQWADDQGYVVVIAVQTLVNGPSKGETVIVALDETPVGEGFTVLGDEYEQCIRHLAQLIAEDNR